MASRYSPDDYYEGHDPFTTPGSVSPVPYEPVQYEPSVAESALITAAEAQTSVQKDQSIISLVEGQFPPPNIEWVKDFERNPDAPLKKSYRSGILQTEVDPHAPVIKIGIMFMAGADKPSVTKAEMSKISDVQPFQKSPEWRIFTGATLLRRLEVGDDLTTNEKDDSDNIVQIHEQNRRSAREPRSPAFQNFNPQRFSGHEEVAWDNNQAIVRRNIQDHTLTIDSDQVKLVHGMGGPNEKFDITCTLVEVDMLSMRDLMMNYRTIVQGSGRNVSAKEIIAILDTMINDVRRFCTRSPRLFRMSTRAMIAQSTNTRYGVDYGTNFVTLTTSAGIRKLIDKSASYYLSLNDNKIDQDYIRPKFLQMLVLLLSLLNNEDLVKITKLLESTFQIPGDRPNLELLILKVLPLASINPEVFLEGIFDAYMPHKKKNSYEYSLQPQIWHELQQDLTEKGYIIPILVENSGSVGQSSHVNEIADDLESQLEELEMEDSTDMLYPPSRPPPPRPTSAHRTGSWRVPWPRDGVFMSTIFKYLQHDGLLRETGDARQRTLRAMNDIPHLEITAEDHDNKVQALFTNKVRYRVSAMDPEAISDMKEGDYVLTGLNNETYCNLEINNTILNKPFIEATKELNILVQKIRAYFGGRAQQRGLNTLMRSTSRATNPSTFASMQEPTEAKRLWADIVPPAGERQRCAEAFKMGNRIVYRDDVLRDMNNSHSKLTSAMNRLDKEISRYGGSRRGRDEASRLQQAEIDKCTARLARIRALLQEADQKRKELQSIHRQYPEDPITQVFYPSFVSTGGERREWAEYQTQLAKDQKRLIVKSRKLVVEAASMSSDYGVELRFGNTGLVLYVEPLTWSGVSDSGLVLSRGDVVLWIGYYIMVVEPVVGRRNEMALLGYYRVRSQRMSDGGAGGRNAGHGLKEALSVLV